MYLFHEELLKIMFAAREYLDLFLELKDLDKESDKFKVSFQPSPSGESREATIVNYSFNKLEDYLKSLEEGYIDDDELYKLGEELADRLLPIGPVRELFNKAVRDAGRDKGVRLRLLIRNNELAQLPWEYSYLQAHEGEKNHSNFLALNPQISIVRHEALPEKHVDLSGIKPENFKLIAAFASPLGYKKLNLNWEKRIIKKIFKDFNVEGKTIDWEPFIEDATIDDLAAALSKHADIFHFAGHGEFREVDADKEGIHGKGYIVLVKDKQDKKAHLVEAGVLASHLQNAGVRVAIFGACNSGRRDGVNSWTGIAPALIEKGIPCVIAMQYEVEDNCAIAFSKMFYESLARGLSLDQAVWAGRMAMLDKSSEDSPQWGVPIFYMRSEDGKIFPELPKNENFIKNKIRTIIEGSKDIRVIGMRNAYNQNLEVETIIKNSEKVVVIGTENR